MTTLAEMTPEQREQCKGMWCYVYDPIRDGMEPEPPTDEGIVVGYTEPNAGGNAIIYHPHPNAPTWPQPLNEVEPRPDLPRAWQPDGTPVDGHWESEFERIIANDGKTVKTLTSRRFVGEWE